jgi:RNA polymerase sigma-70 factor, ECF subfamily
MTDWTDIVRRHGGVVWRTACRLLGDSADAADCFQKTFLDAIRIDGRETVRQWPAVLRTLATARAMDLLRSRCRQRDRDEPSIEISALASGQPGPSERAEAAELAEQLRAALTELPNEQATAFCLCCLEEMSYRDVAERMGLDANNVGVLLHRARKQLRRRLASVRPGVDAEAGGKP